MQWCTQGHCSQSEVEDDTQQACNDDCCQILYGYFMQEWVMKAGGSKAAVAIEYLKKVIVTGGICERTILVLMMERPQATTVRDISIQQNDALFPRLASKRYHPIIRIFLRAIP